MSTVGCGRSIRRLVYSTTRSILPLHLQHTTYTKDELQGCSSLRNGVMTPCTQRSSHRGCSSLRNGVMTPCTQRSSHSSRAWYNLPHANTAYLLCCILAMCSSRALWSRTHIAVHSTACSVCIHPTGYVILLSSTTTTNSAGSHSTC